MAAFSSVPYDAIDLAGYIISIEPVSIDFEASLLISRRVQIQISFRELKDGVVDRRNRSQKLIFETESPTPNVASRMRAASTIDLGCGCREDCEKTVIAQVQASDILGRLTMMLDEYQPLEEPEDLQSTPVHPPPHLSDLFINELLEHHVCQCTLCNPAYLSDLEKKCQATAADEYARALEPKVRNLTKTLAKETKEDATQALRSEINERAGTVVRSKGILNSQFLPPQRIRSHELTSSCKSPGWAYTEYG